MQSKVMLPERDSCSHKAKLSKGNYSRDQLRYFGNKVLHTRFSYHCYPKKCATIRVNCLEI